MTGKLTDHLSRGDHRVPRGADTYRETGDHLREGMAWTILGNALSKTDQLAEAITACQDAAAIHCETGDEHLSGASRCRPWKQSGRRSRPRGPAKSVSTS